MSKSDPPTPPSPIATAGAQTASNVSTALANAFLNNTNQSTPLGALNYNVTDQYTFNDPTTGQTFNIPRFTAEQSLSAPEQAIQTQNEATKLNLAGLSNEQSGRLGSLLGTPFDLSGAPPFETPNFSGQPITSFGPYADIQMYPSEGVAFQQEIGGHIPIHQTYGPADDFSSDRARVEQSLYGRLNPQLALEQQHIEQQLADQGIRYGSPAYTNAMDSYNRQANDARLAVTQTAGQEQQRLMDMAAKKAGFENAAQLQEFQQQQAIGQFQNQAAQRISDYYMQRQQAYNQAQAQQFGQAGQVGQFYNQALQSQAQLEQARVNASNAARNQYVNEQFALRNLPINEITALMSGSQVSQPGFMQTPQTQIPTTDVAGLFNQNFNQNFQNYNAQLQQQNAIIGGLFGAAGNIGGALIKSDRRIKKDLHRIGTVFAGTPQPVAGVADVDSDEITKKKLPIYSYAYKADPTGRRHIGPMAQDVEKIDPGAVGEIGGIKHINPSRVMGSIMRVA